ncbi:MAG: hypothetical protein LBT59_09260 [Clostridiales bacterium]|nr:hypothetical protein [Clostridiales bacterium]
MDGFVVKFTRREIYEEIWRGSVYAMAKKYNLAYAPFVKQLKEAQIPMPSMGYKVKIISGKPVGRPSLSGQHNAIISAIKADAYALSAPDPIKPDSLEPPDSSDPSVPSDPQDQPPAQKFVLCKREELFTALWNVPLEEVISYSGLSARSILKLCWALDIPRPPQDYIKTGAMSLPKLSERDSASQKNNIQHIASNEPEVCRSMLHFLNDEECSLVISIASQIAFVDSQANLHRKIKAYQLSVQEWKASADHGSSDGQDPSPPHLAQSISEKSLPRIFRIINSLYRAMSPLDCRLTNDLNFEVMGETITISFFEAKGQTVHVITEEEAQLLEQYKRMHEIDPKIPKPKIPKYDYHYNGKLTLVVDHLKKFKDRSSSLLEERLGDIMIDLFIAAHERQKAYAAYESEERERRETRRVELELNKRCVDMLRESIALDSLDSQSM